jgi:ribosomal protein L7/L12
MTLHHIRAVQNGYIVQLTEYGDEYIAATLKDVAVLAGEIQYGSDHVHYTGANCLPEIVALAKTGNKIAAIKLLRSHYTAVFGLREAKDLVEAFMDLHQTVYSQEPAFPHQY